jgi:hypothetical protein
MGCTSAGICRNGSHPGGKPGIRQQLSAEIRDVARELRERIGDVQRTAYRALKAGAERQPKPTSTASRTSRPASFSSGAACDAASQTSRRRKQIHPNHREPQLSYSR